MVSMPDDTETRLTQLESFQRDLSVFLPQFLEDMREERRKMREEHQQMRGDLSEFRKEMRSTQTQHLYWLTGLIIGVAAIFGAALAF